ncbi:MAG TPA: crotonobetainyl-CoA--carnitine CoA-transferase [Candidatus Methylomirabilis sp.]|nr:crotonobetainyl-CoA--carnitine CoA-transferase [Candidatus Methylomirabilis sp.]
MAAPQSCTILTYGNEGETDRRRALVSLLKRSPIPDEELLSNLGLFLTPQTLSRILFMDFLYRQILTVQGIAVEFGCRWGQNASLFSALRGIYEPFNRLRKVAAFDTFEGFPSTRPQDGAQLGPGMYAVTPDYERYLQRVLEFQEQESPLSHVGKFELVKGDVTHTLPSYLERNPETIIALAYFDLDLYEPTLKCLSAIRDRLTIGSVLGFDELNDHATPGETLALKEALGLHRVSVRRFPASARTSYVVIEAL